jgi:hypothetical protein
VRPDGNTLCANFDMTNGDLNGDGTIDEFEIDLIFAQYGLKPVT